MYARSTTIQAQPSSIDAGIIHVRDVVLPALTGMTGCVGLSLLVDRDSGHCIATSAWPSMDAMRASAEQIHPIRYRAADAFGGSSQVEEWEIAVLHRDHRSRDGAWVRATWMQLAPTRVDLAIDVFKMASLPAIERLAGFCSASLLVNRSVGRAASSVTYDSAAAIELTRDQAATLRAADTQDAEPRWSRPESSSWPSPTSACRKWLDDRAGSQPSTQPLRRRISCRMPAKTFEPIGGQSAGPPNEAIRGGARVRRHTPGLAAATGRSTCEHDGPTRSAVPGSDREGQQRGTAGNTQH